MDSWVRPYVLSDAPLERVVNVGFFPLPGRSVLELACGFTEYEGHLYKIRLTDSPGTYWRKRIK